MSERPDNQPEPTVIRTEQPSSSETAAIHAVHAAAFGSDAEAKLVDRLRASGRLCLSLVALGRDRVVGHIAFSPVDLLRVDRAIACAGWGLAPIAVLPAFQRSGVGSALVRRGLDTARRQGAGFVVVLGDPAYYTRFGFLPASDFQLDNEYGAGSEFRVIELRPAAIPRGGGLIRYAPEFADLD